MSFSDNIMKFLGSSKKKPEEFNAFSILRKMETAVDSDRTKLKERQEKLVADLAKAEKKVEDIKKEQELIKMFLAETA